MSVVSVQSYARTHTATYVSDKLRNLLKLLVRHHGLDPQKIADAWSNWVDRAARRWLESGHLTAIVLEFYYPWSDSALAVWRFPIRYDGNGVDEMWVDRFFLEDSIAKAKAPPADSSYRIVLMHNDNAPYVEGLSSTTLRSTAGLVSREIGTVISTPDIMASARYLR